MNCPDCGLVVRSDWPHFHTINGVRLAEKDAEALRRMARSAKTYDLRYRDPDPLFPPEDHRVPAPWRPSPTPAKATRWGCIAALFLAVASALLVIAVLVALATLAAPRSAETTDPVDVSGTSSARLIGAPQIPRHWLVGGRTGAGGPNALRVAGTRRRRPNSSPAVANVATSEGSSGPTTPVPATSRG